MKPETDREFLKRLGANMAAGAFVVLALTLGLCGLLGCTWAATSVSIPLIAALAGMAVGCVLTYMGEDIRDI